MPTYELLKRQDTFGPDEIAVLGNVFEEVLGVLGRVDRQDPITAAIAKRLIDLAIAGVSDPQRLKALTIQAFRGMPPQNSAVSLPNAFRPSSVDPPHRPPPMRPSKEMAPAPKVSFGVE